MNAALAGRMRLVVTEKPSVARDLARVLGARTKGDGYFDGDGLRITWCLGHLVELEEPAYYDPAWKRWRMDTLPMVPPRFALRPRKGSRDRYQVVRSLLRSREVTEVVNACDAGREGELIFRYVYELAGCTRPVSRLWLASLTDQAIHHGWARLRPGRDYDGLADAARCRSEADWIVGLNATRAMTLLGRKSGGDAVLSVGRVQTPTLAMIVVRDREIEAFVPEPFWQVRATFRAFVDHVPVEWEGTWFRPGSPAERRSDDDGPSVAERLPEAGLADAIVAAVNGRTGVVERSERKRVVEQPPLLYDLTSLQRRANQRYGLTAQATLAIAQTLYEKHKLITYPRTDARYLTPDQVPELPDVVRGLGGLRVYAAFCQQLLAHPIQPGGRVVDASEVGDHHAIIPTGRAPNAARLSADEKRVFDLVARRFLAALSPPAQIDRTTLIVAIPDAPVPTGLPAPLRFRASGRVVVEAGWRAVDPPPSKGKDRDLPDVAHGAPAEVRRAKAVKGETRPPKPYTDATLLHAMETAGKSLDDAELKRIMRQNGLGTPATRAAIIQVLLDRKFVERRKRDLCSTERGRGLVDAVPVDELKSAELTGRWEARLAAMADGRADRDAFMRDVVHHAGELVRAIGDAEPPPASATEADRPVLGTCPVCATPVTEGRAAYVCATGRECAFVVFKKMSKRKISARLVRSLLRDGRTQIVKGFRSKAGKPFEAGLVVQEDGSVGFYFAERGKREALAAPRKKPAAPTTPVGMPCPVCATGRLVAGRSAWGCGRWREGCRFVLPFEHDGRRLSEGEAARRVQELAAAPEHTITR